MKMLNPLVSFAKIRGSYGTTGSDQIGDYSFYDLFSTQPYTYQGQIAITPSTLYNPNLAWEETKKLEFGLDMGFSKDKVFLNVVRYQNKSSNQLLNIILPTITGYGVIADNLLAIVANTGWEITLSSTNIESRDFQWTTAANITIARNEL